MALSNIFREPKRELIEQWYGFVAFVGFMLSIAVLNAALTIVMTLAIESHYWPSDFKDWAAAQILVLPSMLGVWFLIYVVHELGETVCNGMAARGHDPRPKDRR